MTAWGYRGDRVGFTPRLVHRSAVDEGLSWRRLWWILVAGLVVAAALVVVVATGAVSSDAWTAIAAIATLVEAAAVAIAIVYAARQITVATEESQRRRRHELTDRLETTVFDDLARAVDEQLRLWRRANGVVKLLDLNYDKSAEERNADIIENLSFELDRRREDLQEAERATDHTLFRVERLLDALGDSTEKVSRLKLALMPFSAFDLPFNEQDVREYVGELRSRRDVAGTLEHLVLQVRELIKANAPG